MADSDKKNAEDKVNLICNSCGRKFHLKWSEFMFYQSQQFVLPRACWDCRKKRKDGKESSK